MRKQSIRIALGGVSAAALCAGTLLAPAQAAPRDPVQELTDRVQLENVMDTLEDLQRIAEENDGNRASGTEGYSAAVDYLVKELRRAGYPRPEVQEFTFPYAEENSALERISPNPITYTDEVDFIRNAFTPSPRGDATGPLVPVDLMIPPPAEPGSTSGCEATDFAGFPQGGIALIQRGTCNFDLKAQLAQAAGAAGVIIMNEGQPGRTGLFGMSGVGDGITIPVVSATFEVGVELASTPGATVRVEVDYLEEERTTWNVIAQTRQGDPENVVMAGAHFDGVLGGAGINDNGTGSAALLEVARQVRQLRSNNAVRFAWWGAEESGLLGSYHYMDALPEEEAEDIALYLNFDMIGSPNYMFGIYDGDNSSGTAPPDFIPPGSAEIEDVFEEFYTSRDLAFNDTDFSGRSDYAAFIDVGIPAGGLFTGAEGVKTEEQAQMYGGIAGVSYDPCYHQFCDNLTGEGQDQSIYGPLNAAYDLVGNVNTFAMDVNADAVAYAVATFAMDTSTVDDAGEPTVTGTTAAAGSGGLHHAAPEATRR